MSRLLAAQPNPTAVENALAKEAVHWAVLLELKFVSGTQYLSNMNVPFTDMLWGRTWVGTGELGGMSNIDGGPDDLAPYREYYLGLPWGVLNDESLPTQAASRLPELIGNPSDYRGREANLYIQLFDGAFSDGRAFPVGVPIAIDKSLMQHATASYSPSAAILTMKVEGLLARKGAPVFGLLTDRDQKRRHSTDNGLRYVPEVMSTSPKWTDW
ncbi:hypothetical protein QKW60_05545 [Defluviimonas aestuarii]|uniref:hypothetical protein n=1 Tax=Albidovulum aestuarii TaxID=1130726 RepID=UPI00249CB5FD|nr:hypothetical protein [Defluviimonas aestuarii]MDI3335860.1 hypothetical protein [Defluviimonas aestuarii]